MSMLAEQYVWLFWASSFLLPWLILFVACRDHRRTMWLASVLTAPLGLTEPLFVPEYWDPPSLFDLAQRTGFDVESLIFSFAIGGIGAALYGIVTRKQPARTEPSERSRRRHRYHGLALLTPAIAFPVLYALPSNPIYPAIAALLVGAGATVACRRDLTIHALMGGGLFLLLYLAVFLGIDWSAPGYIERVWNLDELTGILILGIPLEELLFGFAFGMYWSSIYEHLTWRSTTGQVRASTGVRTGSLPVGAGVESGVRGGRCDFGHLRIVPAAREDHSSMST